MALAKEATGKDSDRFVRRLSESAPRAFRAALAVLGDWHEAEDAVQEASLVALQGLEQLRGERAFDAWFVRIAVNKAIDVLRARKRERERMAALSLAHEYRTGPPDLETAMDVAQAVDRLEPLHRAVVRLYYAGGRTTPEIARMLDRPVGTVRRLLSESYRMLRMMLCSTPEGRGPASVSTSVYALHSGRT